MTSAPDVDISVLQSSYIYSEPMTATEIAAEQDQRIATAVEAQQAKLKNFIRRRVPDARDVEDILQDVFYELVEAYRVMKPIEHVGAWLFRVARNRITDLFRKKRPESLSGAVAAEDEDGESLLLEELLPSPEAGPEAAYARQVLIEELDAALEELPEEQRQAFVAYEIEGRSFQELAQETGLSVNTLVLRKHYAVKYLRERLEAIYKDLQRR